MKAVKKSSQRILYSRGDDKNKNKIGFETAMTKRIKQNVSFLHHQRKVEILLKFNGEGRRERGLINRAK